MELQVGQLLRSNTTTYELRSFIGEGSFGKVTECVDTSTGESVAIKINKKKSNETIVKEVEMLKRVRALDPDKHNIIKFIDEFSFLNHTCLVFERLDKNLWTLIKQNDGSPLTFAENRYVIQQLLVALEALKRIGIIHTDVKPDNIMLVSHTDRPFKIKLIDFGLARPVTKLKLGMTIQAIAYRAPEVVLGLPITEAADMWGVGCVMAYLYFGTNLFPRTSEYLLMKYLVQLLGEPDYNLVKSGKHSWKYFSCGSVKEFRLRTTQEHDTLTGTKTKLQKTLFDSVKNLEEAVMSVEMDESKRKERSVFSDLLKSCLNTNPDQRICPQDALNHSFITMGDKKHTQMNAPVHMIKSRDKEPASSCDEDNEAKADPVVQLQSSRTDANTDSEKSFQSSSCASTDDDDEETSICDSVSEVPPHQRQAAPKWTKRFGNLLITAIGGNDRRSDCSEPHSHGKGTCAAWCSNFDSESPIQSSNVVSTDDEKPTHDSKKLPQHNAHIITDRESSGSDSPAESSRGQKQPGSGRREEYKEKANSSIDSESPFQSSNPISTDEERADSDVEVRPQSSWVKQNWSKSVNNVLANAGGATDKEAASYDSDSQVGPVCKSNEKSRAAAGAASFTGDNFSCEPCDNEDTSSVSSCYEARATTRFCVDADVPDVRHKKTACKVIRKFFSRLKKRVVTNC